MKIVLSKNKSAVRVPVMVCVFLIIASSYSCSCSGSIKHPGKMARGDYSHLKEYLSPMIEEKMSNKDITGLSIALVDDQNMVWSAGYGYADLENSIPSTPGTIYKIASITKLFTAAAVMKLVEEKKIDLDGPVTDYIPEFSIKSRFKNSGPITVRMLMTHHSGIPSDKGSGLFAEHPESYRSIIAYLHDQYLSYPPGYIYTYSNLGVALLGIIVERISGLDYKEYIYRNIINPLGMYSTAFNPDDEAQKLLSKEYSGGIEKKKLLARDIPSVGLLSDVNDLSIYIKMILNEGSIGNIRILDDDSVEEMMEQQNSDVPMDLDRKTGLIWQMSIKSLDYAGKVCLHRGISLYHRSIMVVLPERKLGVIVLTNSDTGSEAAQKIAEETLKLAMKIKFGIKAPSDPDYKVIKLDEDEKQFYQGTYATLKGLARVTLINDELWGELMGKSFKLIPHKDGMFSLRYSLFGITLENMRVGIREIYGKKILLLEELGFQTPVGEKFDVFKIPEIWKKRCGEYTVINRDQNFSLFDTNFTVTISSGTLMAKISSSKFGIGDLSLIIEPLSDDEAVIRGLGRSSGETIFIKKTGDGDILEYSGYRFKRTD